MQAGCRRFDPVRLHHFFFDLVELVIAGSQRYITCESKETSLVFWSLLKCQETGSFDIVKRCSFVPFDPHPGEEQEKHVNSG